MSELREKIAKALKGFRYTAYFGEQREKLAEHVALALLDESEPVALGARFHDGRIPETIAIDQPDDWDGHTVEDFQAFWESDDRCAEVVPLYASPTPTSADEITRLRTENERLQERLTDADRLRQAFANCEEVNERIHARVEKLEKALHDFYHAIRDRHHGAMPEEVRTAYDRAGEVLRAITSQEEDDG